MLIRLPAALLVVTVFGASAQPGPGARRPVISLSKRLHVNPLITEPDTMEFEWGGAFSTSGAFTFPAAVRFTPEGPYVFWGRTEFSVAFDSLAYNGANSHFSDHMTLGATCVLRDGEKLDFAIEPTVTVLLRGDTGARLGGVAITRYDAGRSSAGITVGWTSATHSSPTNPPGTLDIGFGYGFQLLSSGPLSHLTPHTNWQYEKSTATERQISVSEGMEYQITDLIAVDFTALQASLWGGQTDHQIVIGLTANTRRFHRR